MSIITALERRSWPGRTLTIIMYTVLTLLAVTMVTPFLITMASSVCNDYDYERYSPLPRYLYSQGDRYNRGLVSFFNRYPKWYEQMAAQFPNMPGHWKSWREIGRNSKRSDAFAEPYLKVDSERLARWRIQAADYADFSSDYPLVDQLATVLDMSAAKFLAERYQARWISENPELAKKLSGKKQQHQALELLSRTWGVPLPNFYLLGFEKVEMREPYWQQSWFPNVEGAKYQDFLLVKKAASYHVFTPGVEGKWKAWAKEHTSVRPIPNLVKLIEMDDDIWQKRWSEFKRTVVPAAPVQPLAMRVIWRQFLETREAREIVGLSPESMFDIKVYNRLAGTDYKSMTETPFPVPADAPAVIQRLWNEFVLSRYPIRLTSISANGDLGGVYRDFLKERFKTLDYANRMLGTKVAAWADFSLTGEAPVGEENVKLRSVWIDFVKSLPFEKRKLHSSELAYQEFLRGRYGSLKAVNAAYGTQYQRFEEAFPAFDIAYSVTFHENEWSLSLLPILSNYNFILSYLFSQGKALMVTAILIIFAILSTLTINPMAAYALSRFSLRRKDKIILFLLATMAFPAMVSAIPAYLLMRDLGLLNTFFALILPSAANGMAIFILKGFFDSLPKELFEAATIDGAKEWQIFLVITMPLMKPILAINCLTAFIHAYNGWEWALIICQDKQMWTLAVWMYQANQWWSMDSPWIVMAGFVVISVPTLLAFTLCQKIIMRGIILPQMK